MESAFKLFGNFLSTCARNRTLSVSKHFGAVVLAVMLVLGMPLLATAKKKSGTPDCTTCKDIVKNFHEGLKKTEKSGFGGGNTNWEEKSLGSYAKSEVRLVEIMEDHLCTGSDKKCHSMIEEYEDHIEAFWFKEFANNEKHDLHRWFCIDNVQACCPENTYGPECNPCIGHPKTPCSGNGNCDGDGTRGGSGECRCHAGYKGDQCDDCKDGYFEHEKNDSNIVCKACHISCKKTCWEGGPKGCDECKNGWQHSEEHGCTDIDECSSSPESLCKVTEYCVNTEGSHSCLSCDISCVGCSGRGDGNCKACSEGFVKEGEKCKDVDECAADRGLCSGVMEECINEPGTYACKCKEGYHRNSEETCVKIPTDMPKPIRGMPNKKKTKTYQNKNAPHFLVFTSVVAAFGLCLAISRGNKLIIFPLCILISVFVFWYADHF